MDKIVKLDKLDRRLLRELDYNYRSSFKSLASKLNTNPEKIRYRMQRLIDQNVITRPYTIIDPGKLGNDYYKILIQFNNIDFEVLDQVVKYLTCVDEINWIVLLEGPFDLSFTIRVRKNIELYRFLETLKNKFSKYIYRLDYAVNIEIDFLTRDYLSNASRKSNGIVSFSSPEEVIDLDTIDLKILKSIANDSRLPASDIAETVGLSPESISRRLRSLERRGVIKSYRYDLNNKSIGQENYYVFLYLNNTTAKRTKELRDYLIEQVNIVYMIKALGEWDIELNIEVEDFLAYRKIMSDITKNFSDIIREYQGLTVSEVFRLNFDPI